MDTFNKYDTYMFATGATMTKLSMRALWGTGFDDIDLYLWDTGATNLSSIEVGINSEPGNGTFDVTSVTPRTCYISANMWLANNIVGKLGAEVPHLREGTALGNTYFRRARSRERIESRISCSSGEENRGADENAVGIRTVPGTFARSASRSRRVSRRASVRLSAASASR